VYYKKNLEIWITFHYFATNFLTSSTGGANVYQDFFYLSNCQGYFVSNRKFLRHSKIR